VGEPLYPSLYRIDTRVWLTELSRSMGRQDTLDNTSDSALDRIAGLNSQCPKMALSVVSLRCGIWSAIGVIADMAGLATGSPL
jgi:hypothetical protein